MEGACRVQSSARCDLPVLLLGTCPGERVMGHPTIPQTSFLNPPETFWCERMQDMSGYILPDLTSPPLGEQFNFSHSTTHHENDFDLQNSGNPSPEEVILDDQADAILEEDANMFDNSNYSLLDTELKHWLPSTSDIDEFVKTTADERNGDFLPPTESDNSFVFVGAPKEDKKLTATSNKSDYLSIFAYEEPRIKEDPDSPLYCCTDSKLTYRDEMDMEIAAEEVVITEEEVIPKELLHETNSTPNLNALWRNSVELSRPVVPKVIVIENSRSFAEDLNSSPLSSFSNVENYEHPVNMYPVEDIQNLDDWLLDCDDSLSELSPVPRVAPPLRLDIEAAKISASQLCGEILPDTPEVLRPVLKPETEFDLVKFLLATSDSNSNAVICSSSSFNHKQLNSSSSSANHKQLSTKRTQEHRRGKSILSLEDLKASQTPRKRSPVETVVKEEQLSQSPSPDTCCDRLALQTESEVSTPLLSPTGRPMRESATRFNKRLEQGYLTNPISSEDEDSNFSTGSKRRRTTSSCSRIRHNSDSDQSAVCDSSKYRERRDRNNVSSKKSRQKRKQALEMKKIELNELEKENLRLKKKDDELSSLLQKVLKAFQEMLGSIKKEEPSEN